MMNIDSAYEKHRTIYNSHIMRDFISSEVARAGYGEKLDAAAMERIQAKRRGFVEWLPLRLKLEHHLWGFWNPILYELHLYEFWFYLKHRFR